MITYALNRLFSVNSVTGRLGGVTDEREARRQKLTMNEVLAQAFVFFLAGFETTSNTSSFLLYLLAKHTDVQERVIEEVDEVLSACGGNVTYDTLMQMPYLDMAINGTPHD